jgi:hypothetical protein
MMRHRSCITVHMSRSSVSQPQRTQNNPLNLGTFSQTSLRYLKGTLGAQWKPVGRADTSQTSNGGIGGGTFNHWFVVNITSPAWIILTKGPPRPQYIQVSAYDLNKTPIQGDPIFDQDSVRVVSGNEVYIPYLDTVMSTQSDLYNTYSRTRLDRGDDRYYPLSAGSYLICVSSTRNETLEYELGVVIEFPSTEIFMELEDFDGSVFLTETRPDTDRALLIGSPVTTNTTISPDPTRPNGYSASIASVNAGVVVTVLNTSTWFIGVPIPDSVAEEESKIVLEPGDDAFYDTFHDHSLSEWRDAWEREHQDTDRFPDVFTPLVNRP